MQLRLINSNKNLLLTVLVVAQVIIVVVLGFKIYEQKSGVLGTKEIVTQIEKENLEYNPDSKLEYFYEPKANFIEEAKVPASNEIVRYIYNSDQLNEPRDYAATKPDDTYRIITLGDSFTMGQFSNTADSYPEKLEYLFSNSCSTSNRVEVINLGVPGYDIQYSIERYFLRGEKYNPDMIILLLKEDDFLEIKEITTPNIKLYYHKMGSERMDKLMEVGKAPHIDMAFADFFREYGEENIRNYQKGQLERLIKGFEGQIILPYWPSTGTANIDLIKDLEKESADRVLSFELPDYYGNDPKTKQADWHPTPLGYERIAQTIFEYINSKSLAPCNQSL